MAFRNTCCMLMVILGFSFQAMASEVSNEIQTLEQQIGNIAHLDNWQEQKMAAEQLLNHPQLQLKQRYALLQNMGNTAFSLGRYNDGIGYFKTLELALDEQGEPQLLFKAIKMQGVGWYYAGGFSAAKIDYERALELAKNHSPAIEVAHIQNNLGLANLKLHDLLNALSAFTEAHSLYQSHGNEQDEADIILNIASVYIRLLRYEKAETLLLKAIKLFDKLSDGRGMALAQANLGVIYTQTDRLEEARTFLQRAADYYEAANDVTFLSYEYTNLARVSIVLGEFERAEVEANFAIYYAEKSENLESMAQALHIRAQLDFVQGKIVSAIEAAQQSMEISLKLGGSLLANQSMSILALAKASQGDTAQALSIMIEYNRVRSKLLNQALFKESEKYQKQFEEGELSQELAKLKQAQQLQELKSHQQQQLIWMGGLVVIFALLASVAWYRRSLEHKAKLDLRHEVAQRTAELQKTADQLRNANQIKSQFLANISHEIRTPLTAILGYSENMLREHQHNVDLQESLEVLHRQGVHLKELISDVLDLSKIEAEQLELEMTEFNVEALLTDITDMFHHPCMEKSLELIVDHRLETPYWVCLDYVRVKQVLINLLSNAIKFTKKGHVELIAEPSEEGLLFTVSDTGIGMPASQLEKIFDYFQQGDNSITRRFGGSGLGLSLSQQLATMMGGTIRASSELHIGSCFSFWLPCQRLNASHYQSVSEQSRIGVSAMFSGEVLVAEDHDDNRVLFERILAQLGVKVESACNGREAVEKCLSSFPDLVLMDIQMPEMDGLEALKLLRQAGYEGPVYALTANVMEHEISYYLEYGFAGHLSKPIEHNKLVTVLHSELDEALDAPSHDDISIDMTDLRQSFASTLEQERYKLIDLWQDNDYDGLQYHCHKIAGAALVFGFVAIADIAKQFEQALKEKKSAQYQDLFLILCDELKVQAYSEQFDVTGV
ncbi:ATP-binding protein [Pseudoalteromonas luteoviolacea]|nr:ATP-binding protein [Pseudoalteromonas luteoviolacea]MBQ4879233.1 response regulator [Pseudoalteromonas luteoviolacea]MBQ4908293.1 response regulator [Pseudoalteromonas luteoviolacea]